MGNFVPFWVLFIELLARPFGQCSNMEFGLWVPMAALSPLSIVWCKQHFDAVGSHLWPFLLSCLRFAFMWQGEILIC